MKLYTVVEDDVVIEYLHIQLTDKIEEKVEVLANKGWKFFFKEHEGCTVIASLKEEYAPSDKYFGSTRIVKQDKDIRKEIILLVNETFNTTINGISWNDSE